MADYTIKAKADLDSSEYKKGANDVKDYNQGLEKSVGKLAGVVAGLFAVDQVISFGAAVIQTKSNFEAYEATLANALGSSQEAIMSMGMLADTAARTPFELESITQSFIKLVNRGFQPTQAEIIKLGDLAASQGKDFDMLVEAALDAQVGEFERLKEFGIRARAEGDRVKLTFRGVTTEVDKTSEAMTEYLLSLGEVEGISGSMATVSATLAGKISNLGDNVTALQLAIGNSSGGLIAAVVDLTNNSLKSATELITALNNGFIDTIDLIPALGAAMSPLSILFGDPSDAADALAQKIAALNKIAKEGTQQGEGFGPFQPSLPPIIDNTTDAVGNNEATMLAAAKAAKEYAREQEKLKDMMAAMALEASVAADMLTNVDFLEVFRERDKNEDYFAGLADEFAEFGGLPEKVDELSEELSQKIRDRMKPVAEETIEISGLISSGISGFMDSLVTAFTDEGPINAMKQFLGLLGGLMKQFGAALIAYGIAKTAIKLPGPQAIAAGAALVAAGSLLQGISSNIGNAADTGTAAGGGEAPLDFRQPEQQTVVFEIAGTKLQGVLSNANRSSDYYINRYGSING